MTAFEKARTRWEQFGTYAIFFCDECASIDRTIELIINLCEAASSSDIIDGTTLADLAIELRRYKIRRVALEHELFGRFFSDPDSPEFLAELFRIKEVIKNSDLFTSRKAVS